MLQAVSPSDMMLMVRIAKNKLSRIARGETRRYDDCEIGTSACGCMKSVSIDTYIRRFACPSSRNTDKMSSARSTRDRI